MNIHSFKPAAVLKYLIAAALIYVLFRYTLGDRYLSVVKSVTAGAIAYSILVALLTYGLSGYQYAVFLRARFSKPLAPADYLTLPIAMNLWSFILPFQGGTVYSVLFFRAKYRVSLSESISFTIYIFLTTIALSGGVGIAFCILNREIYSPLMLLSVVFLCNFVIIIALNRVMRKLVATKPSLLSRIYQITSNIVNSTAILWKDVRVTAVIFAVNLIHTAFNTWLFYTAVKALDLPMGIFPVVVLSLLMKISILFRITPGNLGVEQFLSGFIVSFLGGRVADGALISLYLVFITIIIIGTIGVCTTIYNFRYFSVKELKEALGNRGSSQ